jgi:hypothetical protein
VRCSSAACKRKRPRGSGLSLAPDGSHEVHAQGRGWGIAAGEHFVSTDPTPMLHVLCFNRVSQTDETVSSGAKPLGCGARATLELARRITMIPMIPERRPRPSYGASASIVPMPSIAFNAFPCFQLASNSTLAASNVMREARPTEVAMDSLLPVRNGRRQNPRLRMFVWNEAHIPRLCRQLEESMLRIDPRKEPACGRSAGAVIEPEPETNLPNPQDLWVALANESRVRSRLLAAAAIVRRRSAR